VERPPTDDLEVERMYAQVRGGLFGRSVEPVELGRYEILERIGAGGMGMVYAGRDPQLDRVVALKLIRPERLARGGDVEAAQRRLLREAQAMARVSSPYCVTVFEAGTHGRQVFVAMEFVEGRNLSRWLLAQRRSWSEVVEVFIQAARGLAAVHAAGLVHRDFKPDNVLIGDDGRARVADFGLAAAAGDASGSDPTRLGSAGSDTLTRTGALVGSLAYMSPEQHRGETVDARSDQFSFCIALFEALVGHRPFGGDSAEGLRRDVLSGAVDWREAPKLPDRLLRLLRRGLSTEPSDRWGDMNAIVAELHRIAHPNRRWAWAAGAATLVAGSVAITAGLMAERAPLCQRAEEQARTAWGKPRRDAVADALAGTSRPFAEKTAQQVVERLDAHARAWTRAHAEVCGTGEDPRGDDPQLVTLACLDRTAVEAEALTRALADEPERFVEHATLAVYKLRDPGRCASPEPSGAAAEDEQESVPAPVVVALARAETRLAAADAGGIEDANEALAEARELGHATYEAEALLLRGRFAARASDWEGAEADLLASNDVAESVGAWAVAAQARTELVFIVGYRARRFGEARVWSELAQAALRRSGETGLVEVRLLNAQGLVLDEQGHDTEAREVLNRALALAEQALEPEHPGVAATLENLGRLEAGHGDNALAREHLTRAYQIRGRTLGPTHPDTVRTRALLDAMR
jgi:hypothetical protein